MTLLDQFTTTARRHGALGIISCRIDTDILDRLHCPFCGRLQSYNLRIDGTVAMAASCANPACIAHVPAVPHPTRADLAVRLIGGTGFVHSLAPIPFDHWAHMHCLHCGTKIHLLDGHRAYEHPASSRCRHAHQVEVTAFYQLPTDEQVRRRRVACPVSVNNIEQYCLQHDIPFIRPGVYTLDIDDYGNVTSLSRDRYPYGLTAHPVVV